MNGLNLSKNAFLALALVISQTASPVFAGDGSVRIAGQVVLVNRAAGGGLSADERADRVQRNLDNALVASRDRSASAVNIVYVKGMPVITLGGYQVITVDAQNAKMAGTTPALLAKKWADALRQALSDSASIDSYVAQLTGDYQATSPPVAAAPPSGQSSPPALIPPPAPYPVREASYGAYQASSPYPPGNYTSPSYPVQRGRVVYAPAGLVMPVTLQTAISSQVAQPGDLVQASITQPVQLGEGTIPVGSVALGTIVNSKSGSFFSRSGLIEVKFNRIRTPDGVETPISAHIQGGIGKYSQVGSDSSGVVRGETWKAKAGQAAIRTGIGAGLGAGVGTAIGAIAGRSGRGAGRGAWSGAAIGGGLGLADSLILRKGRDVTIKSGQIMQLQLDAPATISGAGTPPYTGAF